MLKSDAEIQDDVIRIKKSGQFDTEWYRKTYKDVDILGMDPVEHYVKFGNILRRDPNPEFSTSFYLDTHQWLIRQQKDAFRHYLARRKVPQADAKPDLVLWAAYLESKRSSTTRAIALAETFLPPDLLYTADILRANDAHGRNNEAEWLNHLNGYLNRFGAAPLTLKDTKGSLVSRFTTASLPKVTQGPVISVIMPAWNAQETVKYAAESILNQTWQPLELLIVDDASEDNTWTILKQLAASDKRVKIFRNKHNVGPYVSKNIALTQATGDYVTGHDADDWAHPQRLENHIRATLAPEVPLKASLTYMVRMQPNGHFSHIGKITPFCPDGVRRKASIATLFERKFLNDTLGFWDSVRFGADSEMISRTETVLKDKFVNLNQIGMICLDLETSLTNHPEHGVHKTQGLSPSRKNYRDGWVEWHKEKVTTKSAFLEFPQKNRRYDAASEMVVPLQDIEKNLA